MIDEDAAKKFEELLCLPQETEWAEFKHNNSDPGEIGEYLSAISNATALHYKQAGFILWGIEDATREVVGTTFRPRQQKIGNEELENWLLRLLAPRIKRMFLLQRQRFFPMPDYHLHEQGRVKTRLIGKVLDENYTRMLLERTNLDLWDAIAMDKVQKKRPLSPDEFKSLKSQKLIEGRRPNLFVSAKVAAVTGDKARYIKHRGFDKGHYKKMVVSFLEKFGEANRKEIEELLMDKISDALSEKQKKNFVTNLLQEMKKESAIYPIGENRWTKWRLHNTARKDEIQ